MAVGPRRAGLERCVPLPRWNRLDPERQAVILAAAKDEFVAQGLAKASFNRIIEAAGVSKGAMYYYFEDREDLLVTAIEHALEPIAAVAALPLGATCPDSFWTAIEARCLEAVVWLEGRPELAALARALYEGLGGGARPDGPLADLQARMLRWSEAVLREGAAAGAVRTDLPLPLLTRVALAAGKAIDQWMVESWEAMEPEEALRLSVQSMALMRDLLEPRGK